MDTAAAQFGKARRPAQGRRMRRVPDADGALRLTGFAGLFTATVLESIASFARI